MIHHFFVLMPDGDTPFGFCFDCTLLFLEKNDLLCYINKHVILMSVF